MKGTSASDVAYRIAKTTATIFLAPLTWRDHRDGWNLVTFALDTEGGVDTLRADIGGRPEEWPVMKRLPDTITASATNRQ